MLSMENIRKVYTTDTVETLALSGISLHIQEGEFVAVTGPSGSGKSTFLNIAGLLEPADSGTQKIDGNDVSQLSDRQRSHIRAQMIGFIFQGFNLLPDLTIEENVALPMRLRGVGRNERKERVAKALGTVGLSTRNSHYPSQLSGGQQQRAAIARAIAGEPKVILADEPTGNLDSKMSGSIMELLQDINNAGSTIVMVTHDENHANLTSRVVQIRDGQIQADAAPPRLRAAV